MKIEKYGIVLEKLKAEHLEMLRNWRNKPEISRQMEFRQYITKDMQRVWFETVNNLSNFFFIIYFKDIPIGMIHISEIDWENGTAQSGLFIGEPEFLNTNVPVSASLAMLDVFYFLLGLQQVFAKTHFQNIPAIQYNSSLGFECIEKSANPEFEIYCLNKEKYTVKSAKIREIAGGLFGKKTIIELEKDPEENHINHTLQKISPEVCADFNLEIRYFA